MLHGHIDLRLRPYFENRLPPSLWPTSQAWSIPLLSTGCFVPQLKHVLSFSNGDQSNPLGFQLLHAKHLDLLWWFVFYCFWWQLHAIATLFGKLPLGAWCGNCIAHAFSSTLSRELGAGAQRLCSSMQAETLRLRDPWNQSVWETVTSAVCVLCFQVSSSDHRRSCIPIHVHMLVSLGAPSRPFRELLQPPTRTVLLVLASWRL